MEKCMTKEVFQARIAVFGGFSELVTNEQTDGRTDGRTHSHKEIHTHTHTHTQRLKNKERQKIK